MPPIRTAVSVCGRFTPGASYDERVASTTSDGALFADGILEHRAMLRRRGAFAALRIALAIGFVGGVLIALPGALLGVIGFLLLVMAAPTLSVLGVPAVTSPVIYAAGAATSVVLWLVIGRLAARRATRRAVASWPEWRREFLPLAAGVWFGALLALALAAFVLGAL
jgi:hypothetical protein